MLNRRASDLFNAFELYLNGMTSHSGSLINYGLEAPRLQFFKLNLRQLASWREVIIASRIAENVFLFTNDLILWNAKSFERRQVR